jgi:RNA polymerase sigma-70 factor (ECF subfamily)
MSSTLSDLLSGALGPHAADAAWRVRIDELFQQGLESARSAWPNVDMEAERFARYVGERMGDNPADVFQALSHLCFADLWLACACADGHSAALRAFDETMLAGLDRALGSLAPSLDAVEEVGQRLRDSLLVSRPDRPAKIRDYQGRGALRRWVRVVAVREALMGRRAEKRHDERLQAVQEPELLAASPELDVLRAQHGAHIKAAFAGSLAALTSQERNILELHLLDGLSFSQIGKAYGVNKSTVSRWVARAHEKILEEIRRALRHQLGAANATVDSLVLALKTGLDLSIVRLLRKATTQEGQR